MAWPVFLVSCLAVAIVTWALTGFLVRGLSHHGLVDTPNERSSHTQPKPSGGGLVLIPVILITWLLALMAFEPREPGLGLVLIGAVGLATVGWIDDLRDLPATARMLAHAAAVALGLFGVDGTGLVFQGLLPPFFDALAAGLAWVWFINLFNFMDGIDGITGVETVSIGTGLAVLGAGTTIGLTTGVVLPIFLVAATLGFLVWNWPPSKLFLGDVGSVPLGYLLGWLLLFWAAQGQWAAALILPLYYLADATITLARRALRGAKVWRAHNEHFYQRAVQGRASHGQVARGVLMCNVLLIVCSLLAVYGNPWIGLTLATVVVGGFLAVLRRWAA